MGWQISWGCPVEYVGDHRKVPTASGVAILAKSPLVIAEHDLPPECDRFRKAGRLHAAKVLLPDSRELSVLGIYAAAGQDSSHKALNKELWSTIHDVAVAHVSPAWLLAGDFQVHHSVIDELQDLFHLGQVFDASDPHNQGIRPPTCIQGQGSVIDHILASKRLWPLRVDHHLQLLSSCPTHRAVTTTWNMSCPSTTLLRCRKPKSLPEECLVHDPSEAAPDWHWPHLQEQFETLLADGNMDRAFSTWSRRWEQYLIHRGQDRGVQVHLSQCGRAQGKLWTSSPRAVTSLDDASSCQTRALRELYSLVATANFLEENYHEVPEEMQHEIVLLWTPLVSSLGSRLTRDLQVRDMLEMVRAALSASEELDIKIRHARWKQSLTSASSCASARAYAYIKRPEQSAFLMVQDDEGHCHAHPDAQAALIMWDTRGRAT